MDAQQVVNAIALFVIPTVVSLSLHEWAHAASAVALGDETPREQGRLTINPVAHMDLMGTVLVPLALVLTTGTAFGWAKPVHISPWRFSRKVSVRTGLMLTAAAGPAMNLLLATVGMVALVGGLLNGLIDPGGKTELLLSRLVIVNVVLCLFNMLPVPPLDGSRVLGGLLPEPLRAGYQRLEGFAPFFIVLLFVTDATRVLVHQPTRAVVGGLEVIARSLFGVP